MSKQYLVFDIGCLECGQDSKPVGFYKTREEANKVAEEYANKDDDWGRPEWFGQHSVEVFEVEL